MFRNIVHTFDVKYYNWLDTCTYGIEERQGKLFIHRLGYTYYVAEIVKINETEVLHALEKSTDIKETIKEISF